MESASWAHALRSAWLPWTRKAATEQPPLLLLRLLTVAFITSLLLILFLLQFMVVDEPVWETWHFGLLAIGAAMGIAGNRFMLLTQARNVAAAGTNAEALGLYRTRMFLGFAFGEMPALIGFVLAFVVGGQDPYLWMLPLSLILMVLGGPRDGDIRNVQRLIDERGGTVNLADALMGRE